jgi:HAD superfamily hydrolase (TIGR01509 family)
MVAAVVDSYRFIDGMEALLASLHAAGYEMHVLSNYPCWYELIEAKLALSRFLAWSFVSCRTGVRKPDAEAFLGPARQLGASPAELLLIDDRRKNCDAALGVGMDAIVFHDAPTLRRELLARGVGRDAVPPWSESKDDESV